MAICKFCTKAFAWGVADGKFVPLIPVEEHHGFDRTFQDQDGVLRAEHALICVRRGGPTVRVARLARTVKANEVIGERAHIDSETGEITNVTEMKT